MQINFKKKVIVISGGTGNLGKALIKYFSKYDCQIITTTTNKKIANNINSKGKILYKNLDFTDSKSITNFKNFLDGIPKIDILINNAGINKIDNIYNIKTEDWNKIQEINLTGPMLLTKFVSKKMIKKRNGKILNISSIFGVVGKSKRSSYSSSKWGLIGLTKSTALDLAKYNILVNSISPGVIESDLTTKILGKKGIQEIQKLIPMKRLSKMSEIVHLIAFVVSDYNSYITGQNFIIDGGYTSG